MEEIFSTNERITILNSIIYRKDKLGVNAIANRLHLSKGLVSKYFDILTKANILKKFNNKFYIVENHTLKSIRILLNIANIDTKIFKKYSFVKSVGLYGSCAKGENTEDSDVDLWIKINEIDDEKLASLTSELNKKINNVKILFLTESKINKIKEEDIQFYYSLVFGSIILWGDQDGIAF